MVIIFEIRTEMVKTIVGDLFKKWSYHHGRIFVVKNADNL